MRSIKRLAEAIEKNNELVKEFNKLMREFLDYTQAERLESSYGGNAQPEHLTGAERGEIVTNSQGEHTLILGAGLTNRGRGEPTSQPERQPDGVAEGGTVKPMPLPGPHFDPDTMLPRTLAECGINAEPLKVVRNIHTTDEDEFCGDYEGA